MSSQNDKNYNSFSLVQFIWSNRKILIIICVIAAVLSLIVSFLIKPKFQSTAVIFAPRTNSVAKILLNEESYNERLDMKAYAAEEETEQMMEILNSRSIKDILIQKFDLYNHYGIGTNEAYRQTKVYKYLKSAITIRRTQYGAISVSVMDEDPQIAADMANEILAQLDTIKHNIEYQRTIAAYKILQQQMDFVDEEMARLDDSLKVIMKEGVYEFTTQSDRMMQQYAIALAQGNTAGQQRLAKELEKLSAFGTRYLTLQEEQEKFCEYHAMCRSKMLNAIVDNSDNIPVKFVVDNAIPADKKAYPKKMLIVLVSTIASFILGVIVLLILNNLKQAPQTVVPKENE